MPKNYLVLLAFSIIFFVTSCKTDFDVTAPYKEVPVVYGLLNVNDSIQWLRINKAYLGEGNALLMAQQPDSINYPDILDVRLEEYQSNNLVKTISLVRDSSRLKEDGTFATTPNILYRTNVSDVINSTSRYKLVCYNRESTKTFSASTPVVDNISIEYPVQNSTSEINWTSRFNFIVKWYSVPEGYVYQLKIRLHYSEEDINNPANAVEKYVDWVFGEQQPGEDPAGKMQEEFARTLFYQFVAREVKPDNTKRRKIGNVDFIFTVAAKEFYTYVQVNRPPSGVNQYIPQYTNIDGGIGIFSSRLTQAVLDKKMDLDSKDSLKRGSITGNLGFYF